MQYDILEQYDNIIEFLTGENEKKNILNLSADSFNENIILKFIYSKTNDDIDKGKILFKNYNETEYLYKYNLENIIYFLRNFQKSSYDIVQEDDNIIDIDVSRLSSNIMIKYFLYLDIISQLYKPHDSDDIMEGDNMYKIKSRYINNQNGEWGLFSIEGVISYYRFIIRYTIKDNIISNYTINLDDSSSSNVSITNITAILDSFREDILKHLNYIYIIKSQIKLDEISNYMDNINKFYLFSRLLLNYKIAYNFTNFFTEDDMKKINKNMKNIFIKFIYYIKNNEFRNKLYYKMQKTNIAIFENNLEIKKTIANTNNHITKTSYKYKKTVNEMKKNENKKLLLYISIIFGIISLILISIVSLSNLSISLYYILFIIILILYILFYTHIYNNINYIEKFNIDYEAPYNNVDKSESDVSKYLEEIKTLETSRTTTRDDLYEEYKAKQIQYENELKILQERFDSIDILSEEASDLEAQINAKKAQISTLIKTNAQEINNLVAEYNLFEDTHGINKIETVINNLELNYVQLSDYVGTNIITNSLDIIGLVAAIDENIAKIEATNDTITDKTDNYNNNIKGPEENAITALIAEITRLSTIKIGKLEEKDILLNDVKTNTYNDLNGRISVLTSSIFQHNIKYESLKEELITIESELDVLNLNINNYSNDIYQTKKDEYLQFVAEEKIKNNTNALIIKDYIKSDIITKLNLSSQDAQIGFLDEVIQIATLNSIKKEKDSLQDINNKLKIFNTDLNDKLNTLLDNLPQDKFNDIPLNIDNIDNIIDKLRELIEYESDRLSTVIESLNIIETELLEKEEILRITKSEFAILNDRLLRMKETEDQYKYISRNKNIDYDILNIKKNIIININNSMSGISDLIVNEGIKRELEKVQKTESELKKIKYKSKNDYQIQILNSRLMVIYSKLIFDTVLLLIMFIISFINLGHIAIYIFIIIYIIILFISINKIKFMVRTLGRNYYWLKPDISERRYGILK